MGLRVGGLIALAVAAYWPATSGLWNYWLQPYVGGQGVLVAALSAWLVFRARNRLTCAPSEPAPRAILLLLSCSVGAMLFWRSGIQGLHFLMFPALILGAILVAFGPAAARILLVPIGFLYFGMPAWDLLSVPLQKLTVHVVALLAPLLGLPATIDGNLVAFPNGAVFEVTRPCGGVGILVQGLAVATLLGELEQASTGRRLRLLGSMIVVALVTNWARVLILIQVGYTTGMRHVLVTRDHLLFGWVLFVAVLVAFVWVATRRTLPAQPQLQRATRPTEPRLLSGYLSAVAALVAVPFLVYLTAPAQDDPAIAPTLRWPTGLAAWSGPAQSANPDWRPDFVGSHSEWRAAYRNGAGESVEVAAIGYASQASGRKLVSEANSLLGAALHEVAGGGVAGEGMPFYERVVADAQGRQSVIWSHYDIDGRTFVKPLLSQLWYGLRSFAGQPYSMLVALRVQCVPSCAAARHTLAHFAPVLDPLMRRSVRAMTEASR